MQSLNQFVTLARLMRNLRKPLDDLENIQEKALRRTVNHAYGTVRFYREKFKSAGLHPDDIQSVEDLQKIPVTTKTELLTTPQEHLISSGTVLDECHIAKTSGSTGTNLSVVYDRPSYAYERALSIRANLSSGQRFYDRQLTISRPDDSQFAKKWFQKLRIFPIEHASLFASPPEMLKRIQNSRPSIIYGFASSIWLLAKHILEAGQLECHPRIVFTTAEVLDKIMRSDIGHAFGCTVLDQFGCVEMGRTAWECPTHRGYHMDIDSFVFELVRNEEPVPDGTEGEILYTNLYNQSMPLIRYAVGDVAVKSSDPCGCNREFPILEKVLGRKDDFIMLSSGKLLSPILFAVLMKHRVGIVTYKVIQETVGRIRILVTINDAYNSEIELEIIQGTRDMLGDDTEVVVDVVDAIPHEKSGKIRSVVSRVTKQW